MEKDRTWNLFALKLAGKASPEEWAELQLLMEDRPEIALHLQALTNFWHQHSKYDRERIEKAVKKIEENYAGQHELPESFEKVFKQNTASNGGVTELEKGKHGFIFMIKKLVRYLFGTDHHKVTGEQGSLPG